MPGRVDQIEIVYLAVERLVAQRSRLRLDGNATLTLQIHGIEHLRFHFAVGQAATQMNDAVSEGGFAMINVSDDRKIADMLHAVFCVLKRIPLATDGIRNAPGI